MDTDGNLTLQSAREAPPCCALNGARKRMNELLMLIGVFGLSCGSVAALGMITYPMVADRVTSTIQRKADEASLQLEDIFIRLSRKQLWMIYALSPPVVGVLLWLMTGQGPMGLVGMVLGFMVPHLSIKFIQKTRLKKFHAQLIDGLLLMSSSLKAGLSMLQAFTVLAEEMPTPISQEFGLILKETKMGVNLDEAMYHLKKRISTDDVNLFVTAVLVARESGGDVTHIFGRLVETLRERKKIKEKIKTLTFMSQMQGFLMAMLPFVFSWIVYQMNHNYFQFFVQDPMGRMLAVVVVTMQVISLVLFTRFSRSPL